MIQLHASVFGYAALPFQPLVDLIQSEQITAGMAGLAAAASAVVAALAAGVVALYAATARRVAGREKLSFCPESLEEVVQQFRSNSAVSLPRRGLWRWGGAGPLAWRQLLGARRHWGSLLTAMIAPAVLSCAPCFVVGDAFLAFLSTTGALAFYSFLLLPTALRFDFRRDLDRLAIIKGLPIAPATAVLGQTVTPVLIATLFQSAVLAFAVIARSLPPYDCLLAVLVMIPLNVLVFGLDNLIYLLYPYRVQQEGLEIFLRTMLTFTGKGLLFTLGLMVMSAWGFAAAALTRGISHWTGTAIDGYLVFTAGMIAGPALLAALVLCGLSRTYRNMDPVEDLPR
jgi:hypothetical protein